MSHQPTKVLDLTKRMLKLTTRSNMSIGEVATAHYNCLAGLALEAAAGDKAKAVALIRAATEELVDQVMSPIAEVRVAVENGKVVEA